MKALEVLNNHIDFSQDGIIERDEALKAMQILSIGFAEWCLKNKWEYRKRQDVWYCWDTEKGIEIIKKGSELYEIYDNEPH